MVCKPAGQTPLSALAMAELAERAGIPKGVLNMVTGDAPAIGAELCADPRCASSPSPARPKSVASSCASPPTPVKKLSLELGGNAPFIVFDDADLDAAVEGALALEVSQRGPDLRLREPHLRAGRRLRRLCRKLTEKVKSFKVGPGTEPGVVIGPLIDEQGLQKVEAHVADATAKGAKVALGGKKLNGLFFQPTVLTGVTPDMIVSYEETFGPVAPLIRFKTEEEVIRLANNTEFGLSGYFYSRDVGRIFRVAEAMETGIVGANVGIISTEVAPFGGVKQVGARPRRIEVRPRRVPRGEVHPGRRPR